MEAVTRVPLLLCAMSSSERSVSPQLSKDEGQLAESLIVAAVVSFTQT
jgi:hypothetical protein